ncbi:hypothetical protein BJH93_09105 [Kocuria polaris]|nr:hypothetical protein [Kocuria polaris]
MIPTAKDLASNLGLTLRTIREHLGDDPVVLGLQISRRLPAGPVNALAGVVGRVCTDDASVLGGVAAAVRGDDSGVVERIERARAHGLSHVQARRLADVATAVGHADLAERLLADLPPSAAIAAARARLAWHRGEMSAAVGLLEPFTSADNYDDGAATLCERYRAELRTFTGKTPQLDAQPGYSPLPQRVLHLATNSLPHTGSGYAQRTHSILVALRDAGWDVTAATRLGYPVQVGKPLAAKQDTIDGINYQRILPQRLAHGFDARLQQQAVELARLVERFRPAVLHTTTHFVNGLVVRAVAEAYGIEWVYEVRGQLADTWASTRGEAAKDSERYALFKEREAEVARAADAVVTLGAAMRDELVTQGVDPARIEICPNAVGEAFLTEPCSQRDAHTRLGLDPESTYIGTVSSIVAYEGLDDLVAAFALIAHDRPGLRLLIAGDGVALPTLKRQAERLGVSGRVDFPGRVPRSQAHIYHQALDVFVVPRKDLEVTRRVTPLKPVEASASARPVVASDLPALAELVHDGVTGALFEAEDVNDLASKLAHVLDDPQLARDLGQAGRTWALEDRTWSANARKYGRLYHQIRCTESTGQAGNITQSDIPEEKETDR